MYGWRARIGIIYGTGYTDHEYYDAAPPGVSVHVTRARTAGLSEFTLGQEYSSSEAFLQEIENCARTLARIRPAAIVWMTTSGSFSDPDGNDGLAWDQRLHQCMREASGVPSTTTSSSVVAAIRALGVGRVAVASPYKPEAEARLKTYLERHDIEVVNMHGLACEDVWEIGNLDPEDAYRAAVEADHPDAEAVFIAETSFRTQEAIEILEADLGKPVFSANGASMWHVVCLTGVNPVRPGLGRLFELDGRAGGAGRP